MWSKQKIKYLSDSLQYHLSVESSFIASDANPELKKKSIFIGIISETPLILVANLFFFLRSKIYGIPFVPLRFKIDPELTVDILDFKIRIEIRPKEHSPPHFHVIIDNNDYSVSIETGEILKGGKIRKRNRKAINSWYNQNRRLIIKTWNNTRPINCPVGIVK